VLKYEPYLGKIAHEAFISLAKNEHEGLQVIVLPLEKSLKQVEVHVSDLSNKKGKILSSDHVKVYPVGYVKTNKPEYPVDYIGWWPDPLLGKSAVDVKVGTNQPFWIDIYVPFDATAGIYKGEITVKPDNSQELKIPLSVTVWDFEIPLKGEFKVFGRFRPDKLLEYYKWESIPEDIELAWYLFQVEHRYSPMDMFSKKITPTPDRGILEKCLKAGLNSVNVMEVSRWLPKGKGTHSWTDPSQDCLDNIREALEKGQALLKKHNALDTGLVFGFDEVSDIRLCPLINKTFGFVKSVTPEFKTATTAASLPIKNIAANVDIWIPRLGLTKREFKAKRDKRPDAEIYYYLFGEPKHPFPNPILIDTPALNGRISFWMMYNRNVRGFLNWFINGWATNYRPAGDKRWPDIPWKPYYGERYSRRNGEGYFIYPGPDGLPLSSIRFENIRDGIEDWEMMNILNKLIQEIAKNDPLRSRGEKALAAVREIVPTNYSYTNNPDELLKRREKIARAIECIKSTVDK